MHNTFINIFNFLFTLLALESPIMWQFPLNLVVLKKENNIATVKWVQKAQANTKRFDLC